MAPSVFGWLGRHSSACFVSLHCLFSLHQYKIAFPRTKEKKLSITRLQQILCQSGFLRVCQTSSIFLLCSQSNITTLRLVLSTKKNDHIDLNLSPSAARGGNEKLVLVLSTRCIIHVRQGTKVVSSLIGGSHSIAMIEKHLRSQNHNSFKLKHLLTIQKGIECRGKYSYLKSMTPSITMIEASRSTTRSHLLDHWSPTCDRFPTNDHFSSSEGHRQSKRQRSDSNCDYPRRRDAPTNSIQHRAIAKLKSSAASAVSKSSTGSHQSRTYNPNEKRSRSRAEFEILEIRDYPLPRMNDISASICCRFPKEEYLVGTIIKAPIHEEDFNWTPRPPSMESLEITDEQGNYSHSGVSTLRTEHKKKRHVTFSSWNDPIYTEVRFMIVIALFYDHYLAIPLYTHGGNGLAHKDNKWEYASVEDYREPRSLREAEYLLQTEYLKPDCKHLLPKSVAHIAYPVSRKYTLPVAPQGRLAEDSIITLVALFGDYMKGKRPF